MNQCEKIKQTTTEMGKGAKIRCTKLAVIQNPLDKRMLCQHHYNTWEQKMERKRIKKEGDR